MNSLLVESDIFIDENFILPKSLHICMIRYEEEASLARGGEGLQQEEQELIPNISTCAREDGRQAQGGNEGIEQVCSIWRRTRIANHKSILVYGAPHIWPASQKAEPKFGSVCIV